MVTDRRLRGFTVETIQLDLPPLAGALSQRLHAAGLPVTPARTADFARALALVRPDSRRRLYWTARAVLVSDPDQVAAFDAVFAEVFGGRGDASRSSPTRCRTAGGRPTSGRARHETPAGDRGRGRATASGRRRPRRERRRGRRRDRGAAGVGERRGAARGQALRPARAARARPAVRADVAPAAGDADAPHPPLRAGPPRRSASTCAARCARSLRTGGDPIRLARRRRRVAPPPARACCATSRVRWSRTPAPICSS